jgi:hypothetical protein
VQLPRLPTSAAEEFLRSQKVASGESLTIHVSIFNFRHGAVSEKQLQNLAEFGS